MPSPSYGAKKVKTISKPRLPINKLAEYVNASSVRRRSIIEECKYPSTYITARYSDIREIIKNFFLNEFDPKILTEGVTALRKKPESSTWTKQDSDLSIAALKIVQGTNFSAVSDNIYEQIDGASKKMQVNGVEISVTPDLLVKKRIRGVDNFGALKIHIIKTHGLSIESQQIASAILQKYTEGHLLSDGEKLNGSLCLSHDVFKSSIVECPKSFITRMKSVEASCEEIADRWPNI